MVMVVVVEPLIPQIMEILPPELSLVEPYL
jgi:hypothetical protein